ncbi:hypothetical protein ACFWIN_24180 [Streptomyces sp. NPDC127049]|uniref:hypothetical protein n=1 Tax=Streptomyces sp. NPDC127049 TaxID=3347118 RepID=UPI00366714A5
MVFSVRFGEAEEHVDLSDLPCPRLARALGQAIVAITPPRTVVGNRVVPNFRTLVVRVRDFLSFAVAVMSEHGEDIDLDDLDADLLDAYEERLTDRYGQGASSASAAMWQIVRLLRQVNQAHPGRFDLDLRSRIAYTMSEKRATSKPLDAYPLPVFEAFEAAARAEVARIRDRILAGERLAAAGGDPEIHGWGRLENILWFINERGPLTAAYRNIRGVAANGYVRGVNSHLYLSRRDLLSFHVLLACQMGMEPESIKELKVGCLTNAARGFVSVQYYKRRAGSDPHKSMRIRDGGNLRSPGGVLRLAMRLTKRARELGGYDDLWVGTSCATNALSPASGARVLLSAWDRGRFLAEHGFDAMHDRGGKPVNLDLRRLRKSFKSKQYLQAGGVLPDFATGHTREVAGRHYADIGAHEEIHDQAVEAGLSEALAVHLQPPVVLDEEGGRLDDGSQEVPLEAVRDALSGATDVWLSSCRNFFDSPYSLKKGAACPVPPWVCLECPNAVFTTRHLPAVLSVLGTIEAQRDEFSTAEWTARFAVAHERIVKGVLARFSARQIATAHAIAEADGPRLSLPASFLETLR